MQTYRERLIAPFSWWLTAVLFAVVWGWLLLVATNWVGAGIAAAVSLAMGFFAVWRYGSVLIEVRDGVLRAGRANLGPPHLGAVAALSRVEYRARLGPDANAHAFLVTRPYIDRGVTVQVDDPSDPTPYWLISTRHPDELAAAVRQTSARDTHANNNEGEPRVETD